MVNKKLTFSKWKGKKLNNKYIYFKKKIIIYNLFYKYKVNKKLTLPFW